MRFQLADGFAIVHPLAERLHMPDFGGKTRKTILRPFRSRKSCFSLSSGCTNPGMCFDTSEEYVFTKEDYATKTRG